MYVKADMSRYALPFYTMLHPINGYDALRYQKKTSLRMALLFFGLLVISALLTQQFTGPQIQMPDKDKVNLFQTLLGYGVVLLLFVVSNWAFCILADGKAAFRDILIITLYSLQPYIYCSILRVILSHLLTRDESVFLSFLMIVGVLWSFLMLMVAFSTFHEYEFGKAMVSFIITLIGMFLIAFLVFLCYALYQQVADALTTIFHEIVFRIQQNR